MTFKKGDRIRLIRPPEDSEAVYITYADQVGGYIWVAPEKNQRDPSPSTWMADAFESVPRTPVPGDVWGPAVGSRAQMHVRVLTVCGEWVVYEPLNDDVTQGLKNARSADDFMERYQYRWREA